MRLIKTFSALALAALVTFSAKAQNVLQTPTPSGLVTLTWDYPVSELTTNIFFHIRGTNVNTANKSTWPVISTVVGTNTAVVTIVPGEYYFTGTASNVWGQTIYFNVTATPALPRSDVTVRIAKIQ